MHAAQRARRSANALVARARRRRRARARAAGAERGFGGGERAVRQWPSAGTSGRCGGAARGELRGERFCLELARRRPERGLLRLERRRLARLRARPRPCAPSSPAPSSRLSAPASARSGAAAAAGGGRRRGGRHGHGERRRRCRRARGRSSRCSSKTSSFICRARSSQPLRACGLGSSAISPCPPSTCPPLPRPSPPRAPRPRPRAPRALVPRLELFGARLGRRRRRVLVRVLGHAESLDHANPKVWAKPKRARAWSWRGCGWCPRGRAAGVEVGCVASCAPCRVVGCVRAGEYERARGSKGERERQAAGLSPKTGSARVITHERLFDRALHAPVKTPRNLG